MESNGFITRVLAGEPRAVARAISKVEDNVGGASVLMLCVFTQTLR